MTIDIHTHAFPDTLAERAMERLLAETTDVRAYHDGRLSSLLASMDRAGIARAALCSIATRPSQFDAIMAWSATIDDPRIVPLASIHPHDPDPARRVAQVVAAGCPGVKLHPFYQNFVLDDPALAPLFTAMEQAGLFCICHTGFDIAFPRERRCDPARIAALIDRHPGLRFVATHLGAWDDWDEVERLLIGRPLYIETSYTLGILAPERVRRMLLTHPSDRIVFGSDSPWQEQAGALAALRALDLGAAIEQALFHANAARLLAGPSAP